jgi:AraC-like DNA-binding protein
MYVSVAVVRAILGEIERQGIASDWVLEASGLSSDRLADPAAQLPIAEYKRLVEEVIARSAIPASGLKAGWHAPTGAAHLVGFILVNSRTLRDAIRMFMRYSPLVLEDAEWTFLEGEEDASFGFVHPHVSGDVARFEAEMILSFVLTRVGLHFLGPGSRLREARFAFPEPAWSEAYRCTFGCPIVFGAERNELVFDRRYLDVAQLHADASFCQLLCERAEVLLGDRRSDQRLKSRVKDVLKYKLPIGQVQADDVARELRITPRTLRRKLGVLGCTLRELFDEARKELACDAMRRPEQPIKDLAYDLGFAEPSAFHRAFKRWTGITPQQFRAGDAMPSNALIAKRMRAHNNQEAIRAASASESVAVPRSAGADSGAVARPSLARDRMAAPSLSRSA